MISFVLFALFGVFCSIGAGFFVKTWHKSNEAVSERNWGVSVGSQIKSELSRETEILHVLRSILLANRDFPRDAFDIFISSSLVRFPHLENIYWAERSGSDYGAKSKFPIIATYSRSGVDLFGRDLMGLADVESLVERAKRSRRLLLFPQLNVKGSGLFYAALPVMGRGAHPIGEISGILLAQFDFETLFKRVLLTRGDRVVSVQLRDVTIPNVPHVLFTHNKEGLKRQALSSRFSVSGRIFELEFSSQAGNRYFSVWGIVTALGLVITALILYLTMRMNKMEFLIEDGVAIQMKELNERNLLSRHFLNFTLEAFFALDEKGIIVKSNNRGDELFFDGLSTCLGKHISELFPPQEFSQLFFQGKEITPVELNTAIQLEGRAYDNETIPLDVRVTEITNATTYKWLVICRDITARMRSEKRRENSDKQFRQAFTLSSVPMAILNPGGFIVDSNKAFQKFLGYSEVDLSAKPIRSFMHPDMAHPLDEWLKSASARKLESYQSEQRLLNKAGFNLWVVGSFTAVYRFDGSLKHVICQYQDFTDQRYAEQELKLHRDKLKEMVVERTKEVEGTRERLVTSINAADSAIFVYDSDMNLEFCSDLASEMFPEMKAGFEIGTNASELVRLFSFYTDEGHEEQESRINRLNQGIFDDDIQLNDGRWIKISRRKTPSNGTVAVMSDVTAYKEQQELLRIQAEGLAHALRCQQEVNEQQKMFTSVISHEFRTPLAIIDSTVQRIVRKGQNLSDEELHDRLGRIRSAVNRLLKLIKSILTAQRLETGKLEYKPQNIEVTTFVQDVCRSHKELSENHNIEVMADEVDHQVRIDSELLELALVNLLNNAEKYSPDGSEIIVEVWEDTDNVGISVKDQGMGISSQDQSKIFERFFRSSEVGSKEGTGVGLSIVKMIMVLHGGDVSFESQEGEGSTFTLLVPKLV
ncbi:ATP-binding protein [Candidatus Terasakiella magnetica]|uniref:ATP-binding protein n=1 Tax=Candidatus Terasakiella magnetica TaxID=1867952 RepID=UPI0013F4E9AC|nr:ATP-binding protein [Candidatus Terasakiella magnetica]